MFYLEFRRFLKTINEKKIESATGKSKSAIYRYALDPNCEDKNERGTAMTVDFLMQIVMSNRLEKSKSRKLLESLCEACGYKLADTVIEDTANDAVHLSLKQQIANSLFNIKNCQALSDGKITSKEAAELMPLAEDAREEQTKYIALLRKKLKGGK